jgi:hypothetical protein
MKVEMIHAVSGRVRLRVPDLKASPQWASKLQSRIERAASVTSAKANPHTGSLLVRYDPREADSVARHLKRELPSFGKLRLPGVVTAAAAPPAASGGIADRVSEMFRDLNARVEQRTGVGDLRVLVPAALTLLAAGVFLIAALRRRRLPLPTWYDLLWFAFNTFIILNLSNLGASKAKSSQHDDHKKSKSANAKRSKKKKGNDAAVLEIPRATA